MNLHGVPRMTMDIDFVVALDTKNLEKFIHAADSLQLQPVLPIVLSDLLDAGKRDLWARDRNMIAFALRPSQADGPTVDILIDPPIDIETALGRAVTRDLGSTRAVVASIEDMIQLKENAGRAQDKADIDHLRRLRDEKI